MTRLWGWAVLQSMVRCLLTNRTFYLLGHALLQSLITAQTATPMAVYQGCIFLSRARLVPAA